MNLTKSKTAKFVAGFAGLAMAVTMLAPMSSVRAQSAEDLQAQIQALLAQIAQLQAQMGGSTSGSSSAACTFTRNLTMGMSGADVTCLQNYLIGAGHSIPAGATGYFGPQTASAVQAWQAANGISPTAPAFGPQSQARYTQLHVVTPGPGTGTPGTGTPGLSGTEGDITIDVSVDADITIDLGDRDDVIELELEAIDGDVQVDRIDFFFDLRPWLYFDEVNLLVDGDEVDSLSGSSGFTEVSDHWRARFSGLDLVIEEDETVMVTLELAVRSSMAGTRDQDTVEVSMTGSSIRFMDGSGAIMTTGEEVGTGSDGVNGTSSVAVDFDDTFGEGDVSVTLGDDSPESATFVLNETSKTNNVTVLEFNVEAEDSDIEVQDVTVEFSSNASSVALTLHRAYLYRGSTQLSSKSVTGNEVVFDDLEYMIDEDDEETFSVRVDFNETGSIAIDEFTVVDVTVEGENTDFADVSDDLTVNETHRLVVEGLVDDFTSKSVSTSVVGDDTIGKATFTFDLTAYENTFFINEDGSDFSVTIEGNGTTVGDPVIASTNASLVGSGTAYRINKGQTRTFTLEVNVEATSTGSPQSVRVVVGDLTYWNNVDLDDVDDTLTLGAPDYRSASMIILDSE